MSSYKYKTNKRWYHNAEGKQIKIEIGDEIPEGFTPGKGPTGKPAWSRGLTKETDPRVARISEGGKGKKVIAWNKGKTKETDPILKLVSEKEKETKSKKYYPCSRKGIPNSDLHNLRISNSNKGKTGGWSKGQTKETNESLAKISQKMMGHTFNSNMPPEKREEVNNKIFDTMRKNGTFNKSKGEENFYNYLLNLYSKDDIKRQYNKDPRYPFRCDFYIKSKDLFIEYQGAFEYGPHPFDPNNEEDLKLLEEWKEKANLKGPKSRYWNYIYWWTEKDPLKLKYLRENKLNFMLIYPTSNIIITE